MARLLQIDVKSPENEPVRSRKFINGFFNLKIAIFSTAFVLGNRSMCLSLLYICSRTAFPIASTLMLPESILTFSMSGHRLDNIVLCHFPQKIRGSGCFDINHLHYV